MPGTGAIIMSTIEIAMILLILAVIILAGMLNVKSIWVRHYRDLYNMTRQEAENYRTFWIQCKEKLFELGIKSEQQVKESEAFAWKHGFHEGVKAEYGDPYKSLKDYQKLTLQDKEKIEDVIPYKPLKREK
jgi:hypothetical protein